MKDELVAKIYGTVLSTRNTVNREDRMRKLAETMQDAYTMRDKAYRMAAYADTIVDWIQKIRDAEFAILELQKEMERWIEESHNADA